MGKSKLSMIEDYVKEFTNCEFLITREYKIRIEKRFFIFLLVLVFIFIQWGIFSDSIILFGLGTVLVVVFALFKNYPLAKFPVYIIDLMTRIRYSGDIAYDIKKRKKEIRQILLKEYLSYIYVLTNKSNQFKLVILQAKEIIDNGEIRTKSPE